VFEGDSLVDSWSCDSYKTYINEYIFDLGRYVCNVVICSIFQE